MTIIVFILLNLIEILFGAIKTSAKHLILKEKLQSRERIFKEAKK